MEEYKREELKRFENMDLSKLIDLWVNLATPDLDILRVSDSHHKKKVFISHLISDKVGLNSKDTMVILNTKRVATEEIRNFCYTQNRDKNEEKKQIAKMRWGYRPKYNWPAKWAKNEWSWINFNKYVQKNGLQK